METEQKIKKPVYRRWWFIVLCVLFVFYLVGTLSGGPSDSTASPDDSNLQAPPAQPQPREPDQTVSAPPPTPVIPVPEPAEPTEPAFGNGTYLVGKDLPSGLYRAVVTDTFMEMGYIERASDVTMGFDDIIANIMLTGDGYVTIKDSDAAVKLQGVEITPVDLETLEPDFQSEVSDGMYLVGYDLAPGTYKVELTETALQMGYVERLKDASMDFECIIANELFQGQGYVKILESDFAVRVQGATLTLQD